MLNRASLKHNNVFKQSCYRAFLLERIVYVFPISLLLQPETFGFVVTEFSQLSAVKPDATGNRVTGRK